MITFGDFGNPPIIMSSSSATLNQTSSSVDPLSKALSRQLTHVLHARRQETVTQLKKWLASRERCVGVLDPVELRKLWKALHCCFWLTDKRPVQTEMAETLAQLAKSFSRMENVLGYFEAFFFIMRVEWPNIDYLRMDKYLYLVRRMLKEWFMLIGPGRYAWNEEAIAGLVQALSDSVLCPPCATTPAVPDGLVCHIAFVYMEEIHHVTGSSLRGDVLRQLLCPIYNVLSNPATSDTVFNSMMRDVMQVLIEMCDDSSPRFHCKILEPVIEDVFAIASAPDVELKTLRRKTLYGIVKRMKEIVATHETTATRENDVVAQQVESVLVAAATSQPVVVEHGNVSASSPTNNGDTDMGGGNGGSGENALNESFVSETSVTSRKSVRFSHADFVGIPKITMKMKRTPAKPSCELGMPSKGVLKRTAAVVFQGSPVNSASGSSSKTTGRKRTNGNASYVKSGIKKKSRKQ